MKPIHSIKIQDERFATPDDKFLMAKARWKQAVIKILTKLQAYHIYEKIKRNKYCVVPVARYVKGYNKSGSREGALRPDHKSPQKSNWGSALNLSERALEQPDPIDAVEAMQQTSGESDQLFDEDVDSSKLANNDDEYGEEALVGNSVSDGALQTPKQAAEGMAVGATLKIADYKVKGSGDEASIVLSDNDKAGDSNEFDSQESEVNDKEVDWQWIFLQEHM